MSDYTSHDGRVRILHGDCVERMADLDAGSVQTCVTSPPYYGLRDYGADGQIGLEETPEAYVAKMVEVFRAVRRVLRDDGTVWLNLGDSYGAGKIGRADKLDGGGLYNGDQAGWTGDAVRQRPAPEGTKPKNLLGIPWRVAFALQADGWYLRQDIIWHKPNPMPESVRDRCTKAHEYIFLLTKSPRYFYDADAIAEPNVTPGLGVGGVGGSWNDGTDILKRGNRSDPEYNGKWSAFEGKRNKRSVWTIATKPYSGAHFATFPPDLIEPCIRAGCPEGGLVLDPFAGSGTTALVAIANRCRFVGCELNPEYVEIARKRIAPEVAQGELAW